MAKQTLNLYQQQPQQQSYSFFDYMRKMVDTDRLEIKKSFA